MEELLQFLNSICPLSETTIEQLRIIIKAGEYKKKDYILKAGHTCQKICFIQKGLVHCFYPHHGGKISSWFMKPGDVVISVQSFFKQTVSYESIQVLEDCELFYIEYKELQDLYRQYPEFNFIGRIVLEKYYSLKDEHAFVLQSGPARERYIWFMKNFSELILQVPARYIASFLGIKEETLSRIRRA